MKQKIAFLLMVFLVFVFIASAVARVSVENKTGLPLGLRILDQNRKNNYVLVNPGETAVINDVRRGINISAQLITSSYEINCCEWFYVPEGKNVSIVTFNNESSCRCELK